MVSEVWAGLSLRFCLSTAEPQTLLWAACSVCGGEGLGFRVWGLGFRVLGLGFGV